jgi:sugar phosphate permease
MLRNVRLGGTGEEPMPKSKAGCKGLVWFSVQGFGGPCCARILTSWFATNERGTYWGMWNVAHNLGGFLAPILAGTAARTLGWQWGKESFAAF